MYETDSMMNAFIIGSLAWIFIQAVVMITITIHLGGIKRALRDKK